MDPHTLLDIRKAALAYLHASAGCALSPEAITRYAARQVGVKPEDCTFQIAVLVTYGLVQEIADPMMPAVKRYQITAAGITAHESNS